MGKVSKALSRMAKYVLQSGEIKNRGAILDEIDFSPVSNVAPQQAKSILFVIPPMDFGSGGLTSILRIARACEANGIRPYFNDIRDGDVSKEESIASRNLEGFIPKFLSKAEVAKRDFDFVCASSWESVYFAKKIPGYHLYFVQDFEPAFYPFGDNYFLSKATYEMGLHIISLGGWNLRMIQQFCGDVKSLQNQIDFPYSPKEYIYKKRNFSSLKTKKEIHLAVYNKFEEKRAPYFIMSAIGKAVSRFQNDGIRLIPHYFGLNKHYKMPQGENLGRLTKAELRNLYESCDFGLVASLTNISLIPLEMMGSGLPIIEFEEGSFPYFFESGTAIMTHLSPMDLYEKISCAIQNPSQIEKMTEKAYAQLSNLSWEKTSHQFVDILKRIGKD